MPAPDSAVAVTGVGLITCLGTGTKANARAAFDGASGLAPVRAFDASGYPCRVGGEVRDDDALRLMAARLRNSGGREPDRPACLLGVSVQEALAGAGFGAGPPPPGAALLLGNSLGGMSEGTRYCRRRCDGAPTARGTPGAPDLSLFLAHAEAELVARAAGLSGLLRIISNACASASSAILAAADLVRSGRVPLAVAGGFEPLCEFTHAGFSSLQALTRDGVRPFDRLRDGMALGEGAGILVLERAGSARARGASVRAVLAGGGEEADPVHLTRSDPAGRGLAAAVRQALGQAGLEPDAVGGVLAHATATPANDPAEVAALRAVFGASLARTRVTAMKPYWGHLLGAAGGAESAMGVLCLGRGRLPRVLNHRETDPGCAGPDLALDDRTALPRPAILVNALGFGGLNTSLLFVGDGA